MRHRRNLPRRARCEAEASPIDPKETLAPRHNDIKFAPWNGRPPGSDEMTEFYGGFNKPEPYLAG